MQLQQLEYFVAIADAGSLNKAAEKLFLTQPSLSKAIANLEDEIKVKVFTRSKSGVELTEEGKKVYQYARAILDRTELIRRLGTHAAELPGSLSVAFYPIINAGRWVAEYYQQHKDPYVHVHLTECRAMRALETVETGETELAFLMFNQNQEKEIRYALKSKKLELHVLGYDTWYANVGPDHPLADREEVTIHELLDYTFVRMADDYYSTLTFFMKIDNVMLNHFQHVIYANDTAAILSILRGTDAFRFGVKLSERELAEHGIRTIPIQNCDVKITVGWVDRRKESHSPEARDFIRLMEEKCACLRRE